MRYSKGGLKGQLLEDSWQHCKDCDVERTSTVVIPPEFNGSLK